MASQSWGEPLDVPFAQRINWTLRECSSHPVAPLEVACSQTPFELRKILTGKSETAFGMQGGSSDRRKLKEFIFYQYEVLKLEQSSWQASA